MIGSQSKNSIFFFVYLQEGRKKKEMERKDRIILQCEKEKKLGERKRKKRHEELNQKERVVEE